MKTKTTPTSLEKEPSRLGESIKLGIDVHMEKYVVVMKIDGSAPCRAKSFTPEDFLEWVELILPRKSGQGDALITS